MDTKYRTAWSPEEDAQLRAIWLDPNITVSAAALQLERPARGLHGRAHKLGLGAKALADTTWTPELIEQMKALIYEGLTFSEIGKRLNFTKSAVIGKAQRMGIKQPPGVAERNKRVNSQKNGGHKPRKVSFNGLPATKVVAPSTLRTKRPLWEDLPGSDPQELPAPRGRCAWPINDARGEATLRCCLPAIGSYCREHSARAYDPLPAKTNSPRKLERSLRYLVRA